MTRSGLWLANLAGATIAISLWTESDGAILQDEIAHFLIAQHAWDDPALLIDVWGRVGHTVIYALPAQGGLQLARATSLVLSLLTAILTTRIAGELRVKPLATVPLLLWCQPWYAEMSFAVLTEVPFSLALAAASLAYLRRQPIRASLAFGCLPLIRHEGLLIAALSSAGAIVSRRWRAALVAWAPFVGYNAVRFAVAGDWPFMIFLDPQVSPDNDSGGWFHFLPRIVMNAGLPVVGLVLLATRRLPRVRWWWLWPYAAYLAAHVVLFRFGLFKTGGYSVFLVPLAPALAVVATHGLQELRSMVATSAAGRQRAVVGGALIAVVVYAGVTVTPHRLGAREIALREAAAWLRNAGVQDERIIASRAWVYYFADVPWARPRPWAARITLDHVPPGSFLVWDSRQASRRGASYQSLASSPDRWEEMWASADRTAVIFRKR